MRGSQLTSVPSLQTFSDPDTWPLFKKFEVKVSRSLLVNVAGRILKCLWIISSVKKCQEICTMLFCACEVTKLWAILEKYLSGEGNVGRKGHFASLQLILCSPQPIVIVRFKISWDFLIRESKPHINHQKWLRQRNNKYNQEPVTCYTLHFVAGFTMCTSFSTHILISLPAMWL